MLSHKLGMEHIMALGAGSSALKTMAKDEDVPNLIRESIMTMAELHSEACQIIVQMINEELEAK